MLLKKRLATATVCIEIVFSLSLQKDLISENTLFFYFSIFFKNQELLFLQLYVVLDCRYNYGWIISETISFTDFILKLVLIFYRAFSQQMR